MLSRGEGRTQSLGQLLARRRSGAETRAQTKGRVARFASSSGQAAVEYLLVLVVAIGIVVGLLYQFNAAFQKYAQSYFGDYVLCLLDMGELPVLSGDNPSSGECQVQQFSFDAAAAGAASGGGSSGSSNGGRAGGAGGGSGSGSSSSSNSKSSPNQAVAARSGESRPSGFGGASGGGGDPFGRSRSSGLPKVRAAAAAAEAASTSSTGKLEVRGSTLKNGKGGLDGRRVIASYNYSDEQASEIAKGPKKISIGKKEEASLRASRLKLELSKKKSAVLASDDEGFTLGDFLRYILIAAMLIVLVIFIGGQAMQAMKSLEKE